MRSIKSWRWVAYAMQALLVLGLPFTTVRGESALRFDLGSLKLHIFGATIWMQELFLVLIALFVFATFFILVTHVFGRIWCGWVCPQTVLSYLTSFVGRARGNRMAASLLIYSLALIVSVIVSASLIWYFQSPYEFIHLALGGRLSTTTWWLWTTLTLVLFLDLAFLRHNWCKSICPYAVMQSVLFDKQTLIIEMDPARSSECIACSRCVKTCPTGMDIRKGFDKACIHCAQCIDACNDVMGRMNRKGLIRYAFGAGGQGKIVRASAISLAGLTLAAAASFGYLVTARKSVEIEILPHRIEARVTKDQLVLNAYLLSVKNALHVPVDLTVKVEGAGLSAVEISPAEPIHLDADRRGNFPLFVKVKKSAGMKTGKIKIVFSDPLHQIKIEKEASLVIPNEL